MGSNLKKWAKNTHSEKIRKIKETVGDHVARDIDLDIIQLDRLDELTSSQKMEILGLYNLGYTPSMNADLAEEINHLGIQVIFGPAKAPYYQGAIEAQVKRVKIALSTLKQSVVGNLYHEYFQVLLKLNFPSLMI